MTYDHFRYKPFDKATFDELCELPEFKFSFKDKDKAISYMILVWNPDNRDWQKQFTRYTDMKREAALLAGFKLNSSNKFDRDVENLIIGSHANFNRAVIRFLYLLAIPELPALSAHRELMSAELEAAFEATTDPKTRKEIRLNIDASTEKIDEYERKIFGGSESEALRTSLYAHMEQNKLRIRPELMAEAIKAGKVGEVLGI